MKRLPLLLFAFAVPAMLTFNGCGTGKRDPLAGTTKAPKGDVFYGGTFVYNEVENFKSLYPLNVTEVIGYRIVCQVYEGLLGLSQKSLDLVPVLAESWEVDSTNTVYTFHVRKGVEFHNDPSFHRGIGREVTAHDFKFCLDKLCEASADNQGYNWFKSKVVGADEYYQSTIGKKPLPGGVSGVQAVDDNTLVIRLLQPYASFPYILAMPFTAVFPKEAVEKYGNEMRVKCVGTGPFQVKEVRENEAVILVRNENYWGTDKNENKLPYLDAIKVTFAKEEKAALLEFKKGNLDMMYRLPLEMLEEVVDKNDEPVGDYKTYTVQKDLSLTLQYYGFQNESQLFKDKRIRQAFAYSIDRRKLVEFTLKGMGVPGIYGVVPPALVGYNAKDVNGYREQNPDKARKLLQEAGYPEGKNFPEITLQINAGGGRNIQVAEAVKKMLEESLNIKVGISVLPFAQHLDKIEKGESLFWRAGWIADYPSPENFLNLFYSIHIPKDKEGKSYLNTFRYRSAQFDSVFTQALSTSDEDLRNLLYLQADQAVVDDAAIIPLFYDKDFRLLQPYVRNFPQNPMEHRIFKEVYFEPAGGGEKQVAAN